MSDKTTQSEKSQKHTIDTKHTDNPDNISEKPGDISTGKVVKSAPEQPSFENQRHEGNKHTEQQLKQQEHEQNEREAFQKGNPQEHQQGNSQR